MMLLELFDFNADGEWSEDDGLHIKRFEIDDETYDLQVKQDVVDGEQVLFCTFFHVKDGVRSLDLSGLNRSPLKIISTVVNSIKERLPDAMVYIFTAKDEPERIRFYKKLAAHLEIMYHLRKEVVEREDGTIFALSKPSSALRLKDFA